ncbi:hypothetical protein EGR_10251 [Echinococcus granulosus]|uniref:Uncharacterized protein n=1 Tax=Echinococcus granulosus TaxID=6210 RepID=W6U1A4_ECHGR|nr:hypothetical protein EGR_10251 [Echinococcus granulosus]EUB54890.1 hypothetical protein EGR_10251 [Echinococcus granulosus]
MLISGDPFPTTLYIFCLGYRFEVEMSVKVNTNTKRDCETSTNYFELGKKIKAISVVRRETVKQMSRGKEFFLMTSGSECTSCFFYAANKTNLLGLNSLLEQMKIVGTHVFEMSDGQVGVIKLLSPQMCTPATSSAENQKNNAGFMLNKCQMNYTFSCQFSQCIKQYDILCYLECFVDLNVNLMKRGNHLICVNALFIYLLEKYKLMNAISFGSFTLLSLDASRNDVLHSTSPAYADWI